MSLDESLGEMKKVQGSLLEYFEYGSNVEEKYQNLLKIFDNIKIYYNQYKIKTLLYLLLKISDNHHREPAFFNKIEQILKLFKDEILKHFSNSDLYKIFKSNKRLLLFLLEENIIIMDEYIVKQIINNDKYINLKYPHYFQPEIQPFLNEEWFPKNDTWVEEIKKELPNDFYEKRKIGENDSVICKFIQKDSIEDFIIDINKNCYSVQSTIDQSIYETNSFILKTQEISLIEYAAFYGSTQIFKYLNMNGAPLKQSIWIYAIHGQSAEIINILEENQVHPESYEQIIIESIKCHHIDVANYIQSNYSQNENDKPSDSIIFNCFKYYNFIFIQNDFISQTSFCYLCKYDYFLFIFSFLKTKDVNINDKITIQYYFYSIKLQNFLFQ